MSVYFWIVFVLGNILHILFFSINKILKVPDSFAYLQMAHHLKNFSLEGFGTGWFGFLYSLPIAIMEFFIKDDMIAGFLVNILFFNLFALVCYLLGRNYLKEKYNLLFVVLIFLSPILLNYNIHILSENIYLPLFLVLFILVLRYKDIPSFSGSVLLGIVLALLYLTRSEAFIYVGSIGLIILHLFFSKTLTFFKSILNFLVISVSFLVLAFPYIYYLHSFTQERGLTNKGISNLRQAELRGISKMDDDGFEKAIGELTPDNHHLVTGFVGGLKYDKPRRKENFKDYILRNFLKTVKRVKENQIKLYKNNLLNLILGNAKSLYQIGENKIFYKNPLFLAVLAVPVLFLIYGVFSLVKDGEGYFVFSFFSFFLIAALFFTLFFVLDRYFVIFVPILVFFIVYGLQDFLSKLSSKLESIGYTFFSLVLVGIYCLGTLSYYNTFKDEDKKYEVKKIAGEWLKENDPRKNLKIMERFPVVTYYAGSWERWLTPYTSSLASLLEYARYNGIDYLVVDSIDFYKYRKGLRFLFEKSDEKYDGLLKLKEFEKNGEKVILYRINQ